MELEANGSVEEAVPQNCEDNKTKKIREGMAEILQEGHVFYNPVQEFNRDMSICVLATFIERYKKELAEKLSTKINNKNKRKEQEAQSARGIRILEALSATGLRSIRYAKEIEGVDQIVANDFSKVAVAYIEKNVKYNNIEQKVIPSFADAMTLMYTSTTLDKRFTIIDLDPYGCPSRFLDGAVQSVEEGGLLLVTATDMSVLAGNTPEAGYVKYGSVPIKSKSCHEMALRILLKTIESSANTYGRYTKPLLSLSIDFYIRVFVQVFTSQIKCKDTSSKQSMVFQCTGCDAITLQRLGSRKPNPTPNNPEQMKYGIPTGPLVNTNCEHCNHRHHMGGPIWSDPIHDQEFVQKVLETARSEKYNKLGTSRRITGMLSVVQEELLDVPLYYSLEKMCSTVKLEMIPVLKLRSAILHEGYRVSFSHAWPTSLKTNAPMATLWDMLRFWAKSHPIKPERFHEGSPLKAIMSKPCTKDYNFVDCHPEAQPASRHESLCRYQENPEANWGPGTRSTIMVGEDKLHKSKRNQNKKARHRNDDEENYPDSKQIKLE